jgi:hypothetical protein
MNGHSHSNGHSYEETEITAKPETTVISTTRTTITTKTSTKHNKHKDIDDDIDDVQNDEVYDKENELIFYEGWNPINYK